MGFLDRLLNRTKKTVILALDGVPYSLIKELNKKGELEHLGTSDYMEMTSVHPPISSVAWSSFMTGKNPGKHNIFGFLDRDIEKNELYTSDSRDLKEKTIWKYLSEKKRRSFVMNVPMTYPPYKINGKMVSGFLCPDIEKGTYPKNFANELKKIDYRIDSDSSLALEDLNKFLKDVNLTFNRRKEAMFNHLEEDWDFFMVQFMGTDRINHFMLGNWLDGDNYSKKFLKFYKKIDEMVGEVKEKINEDENLLIMSDHGFTGLRSEVEINYWLKEKGYLEDTKNFSNITRQTKAYSLLPGRIYLNVEGRERNGRVTSDEYENLQDEIIIELENLKDPVSGDNIISNAFKREDLYSGTYSERGPDIILKSREGYDLKSDFSAKEFTSKGLRTGMHTYDDAFLYSNKPLSKNEPNIIDLFPTIMDLMKVKKPKDLEGKSLV